VNYSVKDLKKTNTSIIFIVYNTSRSLSSKMLLNIQQCIKYEMRNKPSRDSTSTDEAQVLNINGSKALCDLWCNIWAWS